MRDTRWGAQEALDWLRPPVDAAFGIGHRLGEVRVQDPRLLLVFLALLLWLVWRRRRTGMLATASRAPWSSVRQLAVYWLAAYAAWLAAFYYYRYAAVLEFLAPVLALGLLAEVWPRRVVVLAPALALVVLLTTSVSYWAPDRGWCPQWFNPRLPASAHDPNQLILLPDPMTSFAAAFFPPGTTFVGIAYRPDGPALERAVTAGLARHEGPLRVLQRANTHGQTLQARGLKLVEGSCEAVRLGPTGARLHLCRLERLTGLPAPCSPEP
jgi:hypothetical protein